MASPSAPATLYSPGSWPTTGIPRPLSRSTVSLKRPDRLPRRGSTYSSPTTVGTPTVERIAERLKREVMEPWLDVWCLAPGGDWQDEQAEGLRASSSCAVFVGAHGIGAWERLELKAAADRMAHDRAFRVFLVLLPGLPEPFDTGTLPPFLGTRTLLALLLSAMGLYGLVATTVAQHTREIGVRTALGALPRQVAAHFFAAGVRLAAVGLAIGLPFALLALKIFAARVDMPQASAATLAALIAAGPLGVAALAAWLPARRAAGADPLTALRSD